jgi:hypothetical protein
MNLSKLALAKLGWGSVCYRRDNGVGANTDMNFFSGLLNSLFERTSNLLEGYQASDDKLTSLCEALLSTKGEVSGIAISEQILNHYRRLGQRR